MLYIVSISWLDRSQVQTLEVWLVESFKIRISTAVIKNKPAKYIFQKLNNLDHIF